MHPPRRPVGPSAAACYLLPSCPPRRAARVGTARHGGGEEATADQGGSVRSPSEQAHDARRRLHRAGAVSLPDPELSGVQRGSRRAAGIDADAASGAARHQGLCWSGPLDRRRCRTVPADPASFGGRVDQPSREARLGQPGCRSRGRQARSSQADEEGRAEAPRALAEKPGGASPRREPGAQPVAEIVWRVQASV